MIPNTDYIDIHLHCTTLLQIYTGLHTLLEFCYINIQEPVIENEKQVTRVVDVVVRSTS